MNSVVGTRIANEIGVPILIDAPKSGLAWGPFLRIWVDIDVTKPLMRGKMIHVEGAEAYWVFFKYERLPSFCYRCGILGHQDWECRKVHKCCLSTDEGELQFGHWMRAIAPKTAQGKGSLGPSKFSEDDEEDAQGFDGNEVIAREPISHLQPPTAPMIVRVDTEAVPDSSLFSKSNPPNNSRIGDLEITNPLNEAFSVT